MPNRLATESSPYLLQHVDNPVEWYPWGQEALALAREDRAALARRVADGDDVVELVVAIEADRSHVGHALVAFIDVINVYGGPGANSQEFNPPQGINVVEENELAAANVLMSSAWGAMLALGAAAAGGWIAATTIGPGYRPGHETVLSSLAAPNTRRGIRASTIAPAHIGQGSSVT